MKCASLPSSSCRTYLSRSSQATEQLAAEGYTGQRARLRRSAALHYQGQTYELTVPVPADRIDEEMVVHLAEAFGAEDEKTYGHRAGREEPVKLVTIQLVGQGIRTGPAIPERVRSSRPEPHPPAPRVPTSAGRRLGANASNSTHGFVELARGTGDHRRVRHDLRDPARMACAVGCRGNIVIQGAGTAA